MSNNFENLGDQVQVWTMVHESTVGDTDIQSEKVIDLAPWNNVMFIGSIRGVVATAAFGMKFMHGDGTSTTDMVASSTVYATYQSGLTTDAEMQSLVLDVCNFQKRYGSLYVDRATAACAPCVTAICYNPRRSPITESTDLYGVIAANVVAVSPSS